MTTVYNLGPEAVEELPMENCHHHDKGLVKGAMSRETNQSSCEVRIAH